VIDLIAGATFVAASDYVDVDFYIFDYNDTIQI